MDTQECKCNNNIPLIPRQATLICQQCNKKWHQWNTIKIALEQQDTMIIQTLVYE